MSTRRTNQGEGASTPLSFLTPAEQSDAFNATPQWLQDALWRDLREHVERARAA